MLSSAASIVDETFQVKIVWLFQPPKTYSKADMFTYMEDPGIMYIYDIYILYMEDKLDLHTPYQSKIANFRDHSSAVWAPGPLKGSEIIPIHATHGHNHCNVWENSTSTFFE